VASLDVLRGFLQDLRLRPALDGESTQLAVGYDMRAAVLISADLGRHTAWLNELAELGFDEIYLHHVGREQRRFIEAFGAKVLPQL
jgi:hypothetical protein